MGIILLEIEGGNYVVTFAHYGLPSAAKGAMTMLASVGNRQLSVLIIGMMG